MQTNPEEFLFTNVGKALDDAQNERTVIWTDEALFNGYLRAKPEAAANLKIFGQSYQRTSHLIINKNSPLTPMFRQGFLRLLENGILDHLETKWMKAPKYSSKLTLKSRVVVGIGQVVLIFYIMVGTIGATLLLLGLELMWNKLEWLNFPGFNTVYPFNSSQLCVCEIKR